jgi:hypothetical protein
MCTPNQSFNTTEKWAVVLIIKRKIPPMDLEVPWVDLEKMGNPRTKKPINQTLHDPVQNVTQGFMVPGSTNR